MSEMSPWVAYALEWANVLLRWAHVIVAIAWIGSSFYFVWLDNSLTPPQETALRDKGVGGELWAVHGGGFYNPQKYLGAPPALPERLHWFYWESYTTWLTGFGLFTVLYLFHAAAFLVDPSVHAWPAGTAVAGALGFLAGFWILYDAACRMLGQGPGGEKRVGPVVVLLVVAGAWLACHLFAGRAAFLVVGAMMATAMSANVFFWIIPGQRKTVASMKAGLPVDPVHGQRGKQRSVHNTYFTLPVVLAMISNHYGWLTSHAWSWLLLLLLMAGGALIRHFFVVRHKREAAGQAAPWGWGAAGVVLIAIAAVLAAPSPSAVDAGKSLQGPASFVRVQGIVTQRCMPCHNAQISNKGVMLHTPELIHAHAQRIYQQAVVLRNMPLNNATGMTDDERAAIKSWYEAGASSATP